MKKLLTKFRVGYFVIIALLALTACERDDAIEEVDNDLRLETVSIAEARKAIEASLLQTKAKNNKFDLVLDWDNAGQENLINSDAKMTVVPAFTSNNNGYNRVLFLKIEGVVEEALFTMYKTEEDPEGFTGYIFIRKINRKFVCSLKIEKGMIVAIMRKKQLTTKSSKEDTCDCDCENGCVDCDDEIHDWGAGCDEEVVITATHRKNLNVRFIFPRVMDVREHSAPDEGGSSYNYGGGGGSPSNSAVSPLPKVDDKGLEGTKAECIKEALEEGGSNSLLNKLLAGFKLENSPIDITYKVQDKVFGKKGDEVNGLCKRVKYSNNSIAITIYLSKTRMQTQSFLETARTILHETLHAHLHGMIDAEDNTAFNTIPDADGLNFKDTWIKYIELHPEEKQHNWMAEKYIGLMKEGLSKLYEQWDDATKIRFEEYAGVTDANRDFMFECIAWHGLLGENHDMTEAGKEFYTKKGEEYEKMKDEVIRYLGRNCPTEK